MYNWTKEVTFVAVPIAKKEQIKTMHKPVTLPKTSFVASSILTDAEPHPFVLPFCRLFQKNRCVWYQEKPAQTEKETNGTNRPNLETITNHLLFMHLLAVSSNSIDIQLHESFISFCFGTSVVDVSPELYLMLQRNLAVCLYHYFTSNKHVLLN